MRETILGFESYTNGLKRLKETLKPIADFYGKSALFFWRDALFANILYGVTPNQYVGFRFYEKSSLERREFYTFRHYQKTERKLNDPKYYNTFWDKQIFNAVFSEFIHREWLYCSGTEKEQICAFLKKHDKTIVKPTSASSGKGIHVYAGETIEDLIAAKALLEEFVIQHHAMSALNPSSVNTVRIYTILDKDHTPHILSASIRVGGMNSEVDNFHQGGVGYPLDLEHGVVMAAGHSIDGKSYLYHPGTNTKIIGFEVPNWTALKEYIFRAAQIIPTARLIAWDVAVLEDGFEMIEGNYNGDPNFMQTPSNKGKRREIKKYM